MNGNAGARLVSFVAPKRMKPMRGSFKALKEAIRETVAFLEGRGLSKADAYALCSLSVDFRIGEAVNNVLMVYGVIPKKLFKK